MARKYLGMLMSSVSRSSLSRSHCRRCAAVGTDLRRSANRYREELPSQPIVMSRCWRSAALKGDRHSS